MKKTLKKYRVLIRDENTPLLLEREKGRFRTKMMAEIYKHMLMNQGYGVRIKKGNQVGKLKRIFISHPFAADLEMNRVRVIMILEELHEKYPDIIFLSPLHLFSYMKTETKVQREEVMAICYDMIRISDEVWSYGSSEGCIDEMQFAISENKSFRFMRDNCM